MITKNDTFSGQSFNSLLHLRWSTSLFAWENWSYLVPSEVNLLVRAYPVEKNLASKF